MVRYRPPRICKGVLDLIAVVELLLRAKTRTHLRNIQLTDAYKLVAHLLGLVLELCSIRKVLPLATSTNAKVLTYRLAALVGLADKVYHASLHKATVLPGNPHIYNNARHGHRHKYHHAIVGSHSLTLGC